jgi:hypothetical protein
MLVPIHQWSILVPAKAAVVCPALRDFLSDPTPLGVETDGAAV